MNEPLYMPLARSLVDRDYLSRSQEDLFAELNIDPRTRILAVHNGKVLLVEYANRSQPKLRLLTVDEAPFGQHRTYLGKTNKNHVDLSIGTPILMTVLSDNEAEEFGSENWHHLRRTGAGLDDLDAGLFAQALALANWHESHGYCPKCGQATVVEKAGWVRRCLNDGAEIFPRTDPAIIVSVIDAKDRILLGSQGVWEDNRWSILAGFVEPGESLTAAIEREMYEEAGVHVIEPKYLGSQSWPFPYSLMIGFTAKIHHDHANAELVPDGDEIVKLRWFSREEISLEAPRLLLPGRMTISRMLIEHWFGGEIISATENES